MSEERLLTDIQLAYEVLKTEGKYLPKEIKKSYLNDQMLGKLTRLVEFGWLMSLALQDLHEYKMKKEYEERAMQESIAFAIEEARKIGKEGEELIDFVLNIANKVMPIYKIMLKRDIPKDLYYPSHLLLQADQLGIMCAGKDGFLVRTIFTGKFDESKRKGLFRRRGEEEI